MTEKTGINGMDDNDMALLEEPPTEEPGRQYWFIARCRRYVREESRRLGRPLTAAVTTFGCQMNTEVEIEKAA